jgi:L-methionine (R)-S-oxide reductase
MAAPNNSQAPLLAELSILAATSGTATELMTQIAEKLNFSLLRYNWVGFYKIEHRPGGDSVLKLGPFAGTITTYPEIPLNQGVCGAAATSGETILLSKVAADPRYISRDLSTRSELVVPFSVHGKVSGILDVNSHFPDAFAITDRQLCENAAYLVGKFISERGH